MFSFVLEASKFIPIRSKDVSSVCRKKHQKNNFAEHMEILFVTEEDTLYWASLWWSEGECVGPSPSDISRGSNVHVGHLALHLLSLCDVKCQLAASRESKASLHSNAYARRLSHLTPKAMFLLCRAIKTCEGGGEFSESLMYFSFKSMAVGLVSWK